MNNYDDMNQKSNMIIYTTEDGLTKIETTFDEDTVWLSIDQMAELFQRDKSTISRHIKNVFSESGEQLLIGNGSITHKQAVDKATGEYRKYKTRTLSDVENDYLNSIKMLEQKTDGKK